MNNPIDKIENLQRAIAKLHAMAFFEIDEGKALLYTLALRRLFRKYEMYIM